MKTNYLHILFFGVFLLFNFNTYAQDLPPEGDPGKCYVKCIIPDQFEEYTETIVVTPSYKKLNVKPPTYKTITEQVIVKEQSKKLKVIPAVYETVSVKYASKADSKKLNVIPATFIDNTKVVEVYPKTGRYEYIILEDCPSANKEECMVACYVEYPEQVETVAYKTLKYDANTEDVFIPGDDAYYEKVVVKTPARVEEIIIPAEYRTIEKIVVDEPAKVEEIIIPEVTKEVTKTRLVTKGGFTAWEEVDCGIVGKANILPILYEYNSAKITSESKKIIDDNLLKLMRDKPNLNIELNSHTDSRGDDSYNMALSQQRAQSVVNYLVSQGIARERLLAKGYGESRLKNICSNGVPCTEAMHKENRRTEFRIINGMMR